MPAHRNVHPERVASVVTPTVTEISPHLTSLLVLIDITRSQAQPANEPPPWAGQATLASPPGGPPSGIERDPTTKRSRKGPGAPDTSPPLASKVTESGSKLLDPADTHELVNSP